MSAVPARRLRRALAGIGALVAGTLPLMATAATFEDCGPIAERLERSEEIPPGLLRAVALAESGRAHPVHGASLAWPWTVRSGSDSFYLPSKEVALSKVHELRAAGRRFTDVPADSFEVLRDVGQGDVHLHAGDAHKT